MTLCCQGSVSFYIQKVYKFTHIHGGRKEAYIQRNDSDVSWTTGGVVRVVLVRLAGRQEDVFPSSLPLVTPDLVQGRSTALKYTYLSKVIREGMKEVYPYIKKKKI